MGIRPERPFDQRLACGPDHAQTLCRHQCEVIAKRDGTLIVLASLILGLFDYGTMDWPLRAGLASSALLGSLYSLPPFRLKRFPLLAAL